MDSKLAMDGEYEVVVLLNKRKRIVCVIVFTPYLVVLKSEISAKILIGLSVLEVFLQAQMIE